METKDITYKFLAITFAIFSIAMVIMFITVSNEFDRKLETQTKVIRELRTDDYNMLRSAIKYAYMTGIKAYPQNGQDLIIAAMNNDTVAFYLAQKKLQFEALEVERLYQEKKRLEALEYGKSK